MYAAHIKYPQENIFQAGFKPGEKIAEFGAGTGFIALALSGVVGEEGRVYAIDIQRDVLTHLEDTLARRNVKNVDIICGDVERPGGSRLKDHVVDGVVLSNVLFQIDDRNALLTEVKRVLKPGGKLLVSDWAGSYSGMGPPEERVVSESAAEELFIGAGFHKVKAYRPDAYHYSILFTNPT